MEKRVKEVQTDLNTLKSSASIRPHPPGYNDQNHTVGSSEERDARLHIIHYKGSTTHENNTPVTNGDVRTMDMEEASVQISLGIICISMLSRKKASQMTQKRQSK